MQITPAQRQITFLGYYVVRRKTLPVSKTSGLYKNRAKPTLDYVDYE